MSTSPVFRRSGVVASLAWLLFPSSTVTALANPYVLNTSYSGASFFDGFDFFAESDPTNGFVSYFNRPAAESAHLISSGDGLPAYIGVDYTTSIYPIMTGGRPSVRIESKQTFTHGLIISDIAHMPGGICGTWPAHWTLGPDWPANGEIDIIEGVNSGAYQQYKNLMTLHTSPGCTIAGINEEGALQSNNCDTTINYSAGCGVLSSTTNSYGSGFNSIGGGIYATEWTSDYIRIWFFPRGSIPVDITAGTPDPSQWGLPQANFQGSCTIDDKFAQHKIIFDTTFCGDYAGSTWSMDATCSNLTLTCEDYVALHPAAFQNASWSVNSVKVYQQVPLSPSPTPSLSSVVAQSSVLAPGMGFSNSSLTSATPVPTASLPTAIGTLKYLGCAGSSENFPSFRLVGEALDMTVEKCAAECSFRSYAYAGVFTTDCHCAAWLSTDITVTPGQGSCNKPCPGNLKEICGGSVVSMRGIGDRQVSGGILLSLYINATLAISSAAPQGSVLGYGMGGGATSLTATIISTTYIDVCNSCPNGFNTIATTATFRHCGCMDVAAIPTISMTTLTKPCSVCGQSGSPAVATVTVPCVPAVGTVGPGVAYIVHGSVNWTLPLTTTTSATERPAKFTGAAPALELNAAAAIAGVIAIALL